MASTVLVKDVLWRVAALLQDQKPPYFRWPEAELVDWLNDAQTAITKYLPTACSRIDTVKLKPGTLQTIATIPVAECIPGDGSTPDVDVEGTLLLDVFRNMGAAGATPGLPVRNVARDVLDRADPYWHSAVGPVIDGYVYDPRYPRQFFVTPGVPNSRTWVTIGYTAAPKKIPNGGAPGSEIYLKTGTSTTTISVNDEHIDDLTNYVVARANMIDAAWADGAKAQSFAALFTGSLNSKVASITGVNPNLERLPFAPDLGRAK